VLVNDTDLIISVGPDPSGTPIDDAALADVASASYAYGEIYIETNGTAQTYADNEWVLLDLDKANSGNDGLSRDTTPAHASSLITVDVAGTYIIEFNCDIDPTDGITSDDVVSMDFQLRTSGVASTPPRQARWECGDLTSTSRRHSAVLQAIVLLAASDTVSVYARTNVTDPPIEIPITRAALGVKMIAPA
jgi:hypothetical protein